MTDGKDGIGKGEIGKAGLAGPLAEGLASAAGAASKRGLPPVHLWNPPYCGEIDIRIARDGTWFHEGTPIGRAGLVKLFSGILKREGDRFFLVTPVEKVGIRVDDAPFVAVDFTVLGEGAAQVLRFVTQVGDEVVAGPENPIRVQRDGAEGQPAPYVHVRAGLEALIDRKSFYRLIELGVHESHEGKSWFGLWSSGRFFPVIPTSDLT
ncbi:DUF1285 domain-containing protein [Gemmobacter aquarius]|uniref:DUF1285 domain-containing protein n=1 Tax=Paragemmobacter aquarius TaxID=2169400 RepID=A0A2S0UI94_9RHOB|nr:DUF1285 domain-containing protein [Gemmobacter aquarius]AWB47529.1 DUF1285 domain-containing protein [Gemmobacter aquarius]